MIINLEYISKILSVFLESNKAHICISDIEGAGVKIYHSNFKGLDESFLFHIQNIVENGLISNRDLQCHGLKSIGIQLASGNNVTISPVPIRLTQKGHDFANALNNKEVLEKLKVGFKDAPFKVLFDGSQKLLEHIIKKKIDGLVD